MEHYKISIDTFNKLADAYRDKFMDVDLYDESYNQLIHFIKDKNGRILEVGCGPGNISKYLLSQNPSFRIKGIDMAPNMVKLAKENNPTADFEVMDCLEISKLREKFNAIICGFCMPYLSPEDSKKLISDSFNLLLGDGIFYLSVIEGDPEQSGFETSSNGDAKAYVYYYREDFLNTCFKEAGLTKVYEERVPYTRSTGKTETHLILIGKKIK